MMEEVVGICGERGDGEMEATSEGEEKRPFCIG